jgi:TetR/AcrR family transcriptional repressor of nem operon
MAAPRAKTEKRTAERILDIAERLVQTRGFNNFSYADVAKELGMTTASLHYHFRGKAELGQALITRYAERFAEALDRIDEDVPDARGKLEAYASLYAGVLEGKRMCLCGVLAAEYQTLPKPMRRAVVGFFDDNRRWLGGVLDQGRADRTLVFSQPPDDVAQSILSTLEGAMLVARPYGDLGKFNSTAHQLLANLAS